MIGKFRAILILFIMLMLLVLLNLTPTAASEAGCALPPDSMIGWWPGDGNANDLIGNHNGLLGADATFTIGMVNQAFIFDGTNDYVRILDEDVDNQLDGFTELTIDAWIKPDTQLWQNPDTGGFTSAIVSKYNSTQANGVSYYLNLENGKLRMAVFQSSSPESWAAFQSNEPLEINVWSHIAGVWKGGNQFEFYVNGVQVAGTSTSAGPTPSAMAENDIPVNIGRIESFSGSATGPAAFYHGLIDEVEIFNRALSVAEIQAVFTAGSVGKCKSFTYLPVVLEP